MASLFVALGCGSGTPKQSLTTTTTVTSTTAVGPGATRPPPATLAPTTSTPGDAAARVQDFLAHVAPILMSAQGQIYSLQGPFSTFVPDVFPAPEWAQFYDDQAGVARDALRQLRGIASSAPDPGAFLAVLDAWEAGIIHRLDDLAAAARLSDGGEQFSTIRDQFPGDPLREYMLAFLDTNIVPRYMGPVIIMFGPGAGN